MKTKPTYLLNLSRTVIRVSVALILALPAISPETAAQESVLDKEFSFNRLLIRRGQALSMISNKTGYHFTYDSRLIETGTWGSLIADNRPLESILRDLLGNDSLQFTVIGNHIIIARADRRERVLLALAAGDKDERVVISGVVTDEITSEPLAHAAVTLKGKMRGTVTNRDGLFVLSIGQEHMDDTLVVSHIGYRSRLIPVSETPGNRYDFGIVRDYIPIPEVIVQSRVPQELIKKSIARIPDNYGDNTRLLTAFYREGVQKGRELQVYSEAVIDIYKAPYTLIGRDQIKVTRSRKSENARSSDTLLLRLRAGMGSSLQLDGISNRFEFFDEEGFNLYNYIMTDIVTIDGERAYVIDFEQKEIITEPLFRGRMVIHSEDYALLEVEFEVNPSYIDDVRHHYVTGRTRGYDIRPRSVKYRVAYRKDDGQYHLSHVRGDLRFSARRPRRLFRSNYDVFFEMAVTSIGEKNPAPFARDETIPLQSVFSREMKGYDPEFWEGIDFMSPEKDLMEILNTIAFRLSLFSDDDK